ncbi:hypothetical protein [Thalassotalea castellviae]|uniref:Uncharacterized protein n=1 Tax=Thalassotalea castellviae TaxID=3075612 RepID=A0ABU3A358_9GAMM|nr:hypothetical protein [Thalassotalea sp. W431]MDT0604323.1 hypothetical protein [Thalassotalea sp. W431]
MGILSFYKQKASIDIDVISTQSTCLLTTYYGPYFANLEIASKYHEAFADVIFDKMFITKEDHDAKDSHLIVDQKNTYIRESIVDGVFHLELMMPTSCNSKNRERIEKEYLPNFKDVLLKQLNKAQEEIQDVKFSIADDDFIEDGNIAIKFGSNSRSGTKTIMRVLSAEVEIADITIADSDKERPDIYIDRFVLEKANIPVASAEIGSDYILISPPNIQFNGEENYCPIVTVPSGWSFTWDKDRITVYFNNSGIKEEFSLTIEVDLKLLVENSKHDIKNSYSSDDKVIHSEQPIDHIQEATQQAHYQSEFSPLKTISNQVDEKHTCFDDEFAPLMTKRIQEPSTCNIKLSSLVIFGDYLNLYGLDETCAKDLQKVDCNHDGLNRLGVSKLALIKEGPEVCVKSNKTVSFGRNNKELNKIESYKGFDLTGKHEPIAPYGFSREHLQVLLSKDGVVEVTPIPDKPSCYLIEKTAVTEITEKVKTKSGTLILIGCFIFKLTVKND